MGILVDSGVFIRWEREGRSFDFAKLTLIGEPFISVVTVSELKVGVHRANTPERRAKRSRFVATVLSCVTVLDVDSAVAEIHARIVADDEGNYDWPP